MNSRIKSITDKAENNEKKSLAKEAKRVKNRIKVPIHLHHETLHKLDPFKTPLKNSKLKLQTSKKNPGSNEPGL